MRLLIAGGGTGGGIYPALSVLDELLTGAEFSTRLEDVAWVGRSGGLEERVMARRGVPFVALPSGPLRGKAPATVARSIAQMIRGVRRGRALLAEFRPDAVLATGGYVSAPMLVAAWRRCPSLIYLPDAVPGLAIRYLAPLATRVAVSFEEVLAHFRPGKAFVSGYPVRREVLAAAGDRERARQHWGVTDGAPLVLVMGGSTGGRGINGAVASQLGGLLEEAAIIHLCGEAQYEDLAAVREALPAPLQGRYRLHAYLHEEMPLALAAADLAVARAGAATLGEFPAVGLPAILVPYPYSGQHQQPNADLLARRGAAVVVEEADLERRLLGEVRALLQDVARREAMARASRALAVPGAAAAIASELMSLARAGRA